MQFGVKTTEEVDFPTSGGVSFIRYFGKNGSYTLRFLEPWTEWVSYWEHYSEDHRCSYPCTANTPAERKECPGCQLKEKNPGNARAEKEAKASKKYLVNAIRTDDPEDEGYVHLWKIPGSLKEPLEASWTRDGSMSKREYNVIRFEKTNRVNYALDKEDPSSFDVTSYKDRLLDKQKALLDAWEYRWDDSKREAQQAVTKAKKEAKEEERVTGFNKPPTQEEDPPFESAPEQEQVLGEAEIRAMDASTLKSWFARAGVPIPDTEDTKVLSETLISALEP